MRAEGRRIPSSSSGRKSAAAAPQADTPVAPLQTTTKELQHQLATVPVPTPDTGDSACSVRSRGELEVTGLERSVLASEGEGCERTGAPLESAGFGGQQTPLRATHRLPPSQRRPKTPHIDGTTAQRSASSQFPPTGDIDAASDDTVVVGGGRETQQRVSANAQLLGARLANAESARRSATAAAAAAAEAVASAASHAYAVGANRRPMGELTRSDSTDSRRSRSSRSIRSTSALEQQSPKATSRSVDGRRAPRRVDTEETDQISEFSTSRGWYAPHAAVEHTLSPRTRENSEASYDTWEFVEPAMTPECAARRRPTQAVPSSHRGGFESGTTLPSPDFPSIAAARKPTASMSPRARPRAPVSSPTLRSRSGTANAGSDKGAVRPTARKAGAHVVAPEKGAGDHVSNFDGKDRAASQEPQAIAVGQPSCTKRYLGVGEPADRRRQRPLQVGDETEEGRAEEYSSHEEETEDVAYVAVDADNVTAPDERARFSTSSSATFSMSSSMTAIEAVRHAAAKAAGEDEDARRHEAAGELALRLISAHREDVRSALAAARKDMDLVSKADQDRHPTALIEYAREVEGVLGERLAAAAKLRAALDSYVTMRKASFGARQLSADSGAQEENAARAGRGVRV